MYTVRVAVVAGMQASQCTCRAGVCTRRTALGSERLHITPQGHCSGHAVHDVAAAGLVAPRGARRARGLLRGERSRRTAAWAAGRGQGREAPEVH